VHRIFRQPAGLAGGRAEEGALAGIPDAGGFEILIEELFELVMLGVASPSASRPSPAAPLYGPDPIFMSPDAK
jgi:hypothetical protein